MIFLIFVFLIIVCACITYRSNVKGSGMLDHIVAGLGHKDDVTQPLPTNTNVQIIHLVLSNLCKFLPILLEVSDMH